MFNLKKITHSGLVCLRRLPYPDLKPLAESGPDRPSPALRFCLEQGHPRPAEPSSWTAEPAILFRSAFPQDHLRVRHRDVFHEPEPEPESGARSRVQKEQQQRGYATASTVQKYTSTSLIQHHPGHRFSVSSCHAPCQVGTHVLSVLFSLFEDVGSIGLD